MKKALFAIALLGSTGLVNAQTVGSPCHTEGNIINSDSSLPLICHDNKQVQTISGGITAFTHFSPVIEATFITPPAHPVLSINVPTTDTNGTVDYHLRADKGWTCKPIMGQDSKSFVIVCTLDEPVVSK